jgi:RimJ/RimL family protein N-acetyltransferase
MRLDSKRLYLLPLSLKELDSGYVSWLNDADVCRYNSHGETEYTSAMARKYIQSLDGDDSRMVFAVYLKETGMHIGNISLQDIDRQNCKAEIAYLFGEKTCWGCGYASEASELLLELAFETLKLHRLHFGTHVDNIGMRKLGESLGFQYEGTRKEDQYKQGQFNDVVIYGLVRKQ